MGSKNSQVNESPIEIVSDDQSDEIIGLMAIKSVSESLKIVDRLMLFSQQHGNEELDQSLKDTEKLQDAQITNRRQEKSFVLM